MLAGLSACSTVSYYSQSVMGQLEIMQKSTSIDEYLKQDNLPDQLVRQLSMVKEIRKFAVDELGLPDNNSYLRYADLGRDYVVWNVFASPEFRLENREWCYLIAGCLGYRGYFSRDDAIQLASELENQGYDVFVGGVSAYSTLGWFSDPVLNTMLYRDTVYLAKVIFHELAHQKVYIKSDTEMNEAFADTVAITGVQRWLQRSGKSDLYEEFLLEQSRENRFVDLVLHYREKLDELYQSQPDIDLKRKHKNIIIQDMINQYQNIRSEWDNDSNYDLWFAMGVNNAKLMTVVTYRQFVPGFNSLLSAVNDNLEEFYQLITKLGRCSPGQRREILFSGKADFSC